ncbi:MAG: 2-oxoglutarate dehydrogenase subunit E1 [Tistrella sp.]|uniref:2-oxoglutarate dehydrogenase E1 component n=2 Tax=Tistrella mobilis TaxID=171437 RepID=I3TQ06_TISMK|nr:MULTISPECIES: 2-oxoglutarate dehydrogenase E1 component [Tistrella]AFK54844.1 2-oxoglutarate dehydrogenase E1 component [Tistrella mobilis KA081020-065]KYO56305.1 2-oxoglutarate dehydrogenase subunit E1 [Tistrella mobilis]MAD37824.1 2-oxoglutarate dehydrogenase subunit E1 [Tistrella sp.]MAM72975.1 2-oxoglutarate dehydrogenase subunit E1 [Tistrella sp.]MBA78522.1 2-oxoglutarate dehydrogenase subunit E1 [Tistrella sp.]
MAAQSEQLSFLFGSNGAFIADLYARFVQNPMSVDESWQGFFADLGDEAASVLAEVRGAPWAPGIVPGTATNGHADTLAFKADGATGLRVGPVNGKTGELPTERSATVDSIRLLMLIRAYRVRGHLVANLDPLGLETPSGHPELDPASYGFTEDDLDRTFYVDGVLGLENATLREILHKLQSTYCGKVGVEFMHIQSPEQKAWLQSRIEADRPEQAFDAETRKRIFGQVVIAEGFERFLNIKYTGTKRFSLEGGEALVPALEAILESSSDLGCEEVVLGMPHRGRLNVLTAVMGKSFTAVFNEFNGGSATPEDVQGSGDVKYHLGTSTDRTLANGKTVHLSLTANPSHLEAVNPVVVGKTRAKQGQRGDTDRVKVLSILLHGDAAFAGQGVVAECFALSELKGYRTGGTVHVIVNNQIGFTTSPKYSRSSPYPSDVAKMVDAPVFHVNGDDPEAVVWVARLAAEFRQIFHKDVVLDIFCYRRHGHNEADEPSFTQPLMYRKIAQHPTLLQIYGDRMVNDGVMTRDEVDGALKSFHQRLEQDLEQSKTYKPNKADWFEGVWKGYERAPNDDRRGSTAVSLERLREIGFKLTDVPEGVNVHRKIQRQLGQKREAIANGEGLDWALGEALAFGTLLTEGYPVRLSGQDVGRGTFSHRHSVLVDQKTEERYVPLNNLGASVGYEVVDSLLSEYAVLGFEYGYSLAEPNALVVWEAQFGDFVNGAQVMIDQFISSAESKWLRMSGLVMLLPHGYEGQGPEHSSARPERFLQLYGEDNIQVANCTTPSNYFHILRRQIHRKFRKPLIMMTPKSLLRHKLAVSKLSDMGPGSSFHRVLGEVDQLRHADKIRRVLLCTGKVYYDLLEERRARGIEDVAIIRVEQLAPFPATSIAEELRRYPNAEVLWVQEEPKNQGYWFFMSPRLDDLIDSMGASGKRVRYAGRPEAAAPATGSHHKHVAEQKALIDDALAG